MSYNSKSGLLLVVKTETEERCATIEKKILKKATKLNLGKGLFQWKKGGHLKYITKT